jgi:PAS domain S-box-containing protein
VVTQLPLSLVQQNALDIALPVLGLLLLLGLLAFLLLRASLGTVTTSLQKLVVESQRIAAGDLEAPLAMGGSDEVGRLGQAFEQMRRMLKARLEDIQRLLSVSKGLASSLDVTSQINPILEAALASGASMARLVFSASGSPEFEGKELAGFGVGTEHAAYESLDAQVLALTRSQERVLLTNPARARLNFKELPIPAALAAFGLLHGEEHLGALWLTYEQPEKFGRETVRYLSTLAEQAAQAVANATRYLGADLARQRMEALLFASPDPVILIDTAGHIILANPSAMAMLGHAGESAPGMRVEEIIEDEAWLAMFDTPVGEEVSAELRLGDGRVFFASLSPIQTGAEITARACILREVTQFKQAEALRAEFLSTVSHELQDPLELLGGYVTMLEMVGELNEKQTAYLEKISQSVGGMSRLVASLLDLERIESAGGLQLHAFALPEAIEEVVAEIKPRITQKQLELDMQLPDETMPALNADRTLLQRAIYNLLDNAIRHSPRSGKVELWLSMNADAVTIAVKDQGPGVAPMDLAHVFERLGRGGGEGDSRGGLGLAIVKSIFERHGGRVWAESELGLGSTFFGRLPLRPSS